MQEQILICWISLPDEIKLFFISIVPNAKVWFGIPMGIGIFKFSVLKTTFICCLASFIKIPFYYFSIYYTDCLFNKIKWVNNKRNNQIENVKKNHTKKFNILGNYALALIAGLPVPVVFGIFQAVAAAYIFKVKFSKGVLYIIFGITISAYFEALSASGLIAFLIKNIF